MEYIYLACSMCSSAILSIMTTLFGRANAKQKNTSSLYTVIATCAAFASWGIIYFCDAEFSPYVIIYSIAYGLFYTTAMIGMFKAYQIGSVSLTAFIKQLSLIGVAFWGFIFWNNRVTFNIALGLILIIFALYFCFKSDKASTEKAITFKWIVYAFMLLTGNAGCSIIQKYQQLAFDGRYKNMFMLFGTGIAVVFSLILYFNKNRCELRKISKKTILFPIIGGINSALLNLLILLMISSPLSESIIFPGIAVGGLILTTLFSVIGYHEKLHPYRCFGIGVGAIALIFLNM